MVETWKLKQIKELAEIYSGGTPSTGNKEYWNGNIVWITPSDITKQNRKYISTSERKITESGLNSSSAGILPIGTILLCSRATIGEMSIASKPLSTNQGFKNLICNDSVDNEYLYYALQPMKEKMKEQSIGTTFLEISKSALGNIEIFITTDKKEQKQIAKVLSDTDELISNLQKLIDKKEKIKNGIMYNLLNNHTSLNENASKWLTVMLQEVGKITGAGVDKKINFDEHPITLLNYLDVYRNSHIYRDMLSHIVTAKREKITQCHIIENDVLYTPTSETPDDIAKSAIAMETMNDVVYSYHLFRLRPNSKFDGHFISYASKTSDFYNQTLRLADGSGTRYVIPLKKFRELQIFCPQDKKEQKKIANVLYDVDLEIKMLSKKLSRYKNLKTGMMQQLLSGKIRLNVEEAC